VLNDWGEGLVLSGEMLWQVTPLLLLAFATAGLISVVISKDTLYDGSTVYCFCCAPGGGNCCSLYFWRRFL